ncbi:MAG TPA: DUF3050 domain-containing protein [Myxococcota bacterium]|nr:DUF3050 domain-containing protein [Myxococcota bacterium]
MLVEAVLIDARRRLIEHPLVAALDQPAAWRIFMQHHVFAVWDFMTLLKRLQRELTCVELPWRPAASSRYARFVNSLVLAEESDDNGRGGCASHFKLYLEAMDECGADTRLIDTFMDGLLRGKAPLESLDTAGAPPTVRQFVSTTLDIATRAPLSDVCAAFFYGREDIVPPMFEGLLRRLEEGGRNTERLRYYMDRHMRVETQAHSPTAGRLLAHLCEGQPEVELSAQNVALRALSAREALWTGILDQVRAARPMTSLLRAIA